MLLRNINFSELECKICHKLLTIDKFKHFKRKGEEAIKPFCIKCSIEENKKYKQYKKQYFLKNKERLIAKNKKYIENNKQKMLEYYKNYNISRIESAKQYRKEYYQKNKQIINKKVLEAKKKDLNKKIAHSLRNRIVKALNGILKSEKTINLLGCTINQFRIHLEKQFTEQMNWQNYGSYWHIDHIKPCASYNLKEEIQQKECFNYKNLRPLEAKENLKKGKKIL